MRLRILMLVPCLAFALPLPGARADEKVVISAGKSVRDELLSKLNPRFTKETGIAVEYYPSPPSSAADYVRELVEGKSEAALSSAAAEDWLADAKTKGVTIPNDVASRVIARNSLYLFTNADTGAKRLSSEQIIAIFTGKTKNWKEVGGKDLKVTVLFAQDKLNARHTLEKTLLRGQAFTTEAQILPSLKDVLERIDSSPGEIAYGGFHPEGKNTVVIETPELGRPVTMLNRGRPSAKLEKYINYLRAHAPEVLLKK